MRIFSVIAGLCLLTSSAAFATEPAKGSPVLARVNGVGITVKELEFFLSKQEQQMSPQQGLAEMINVELLVQAARNADAMKNEGLALEIQHSTSNLIATHYLRRFLTGLSISEDDLYQRYQADYVKGVSGLEYNANHILVESEEQARDLIKQLQAGGDFAELAQQHSTGPSGKNGGALGWFKKTDMVAPFAEATAALEPGKIAADPVQTQFGWHVIKLNETRKLTPPEFQAVRQQLNTRIAAENISDMIRSLHEKASIEFVEPDSKAPAE